MDGNFIMNFCFNSDDEKIAEYTEKLNNKLNTKHHILDISYNSLTETMNVMCRIESIGFFKSVLNSMLVFYSINKNFVRIKKYIYIDIKNKIRIGGVENLSKGIITNDYVVFDNFENFVNSMHKIIHQN